MKILSIIFTFYKKFFFKIRAWQLGHAPKMEENHFFLHENVSILAILSIWGQFWHLSGLICIFLRYKYDIWNFPKVGVA